MKLAVISFTRTGEGICEKLSVLNFGQLLCEGKTAEVLKNPEVITAYLGE